MLCASTSALRPWLAEGRLWERVDFLAQASPTRPLAAHLQQFAAWVAACRPHLRCLTIAFDWFCQKLTPIDYPALLALLSSLCSAPQLAELRLKVHAVPRGVRQEDVFLEGAMLQLPALEFLALTFPDLGLRGSLAHLERLHTLSLAGVELIRTTRLPASLTALKCSSSPVNEWSSADAILYMPAFGAPGLRTLAIKGSDDEQGMRPLFVGGLGELTALTSLSIDGPELHRWEEDEEEDWDSDEEGAAGQHAAQLTPAMREMALLPALERLALDGVSGVAAEEQLLWLPRWPALKVRWLEPCCRLPAASWLLVPARQTRQERYLQVCGLRSVFDLSDLRITGLPQLQVQQCMLVHECTA